MQLVNEPVLQICPADGENGRHGGFLDKRRSDASCRVKERINGTQLFDCHGMSGCEHNANATLSTNRPWGVVCHVLNRAAARLALFEKDGEYGVFEGVLWEALSEHSTRRLAHCIMPHPWHPVLWPQKESERTQFRRGLTHTPAMRWRTHFRTSGAGHLDQDRFKAFPIQTDEHFYTVVRDVEREALRAKLVGCRRCPSIS